MGKKLESNFTNMVLVLFVITLIASVGVASVYTLTKDTIATAETQKQANAIREVIPEFDNMPMESAQKIAIDNDTVILYTATMNNEAVGTAIKTFTNNGFGGRVELMIGILPDGKISDYKVLEIHETPGLGSKMSKWFKEGGKGNVSGKKPGNEGLKVKKDGGNVDAISGATISSRAFLDAVNRAYRALNYNDEPAKADSYSGASQQSKAK